MLQAIEISTPEKEGILQVSKSRKLPILIDAQEMRALFKELGAFEIFDVSRPLLLESAVIPHETFLSAYERYVEGIQEGRPIEETDLKPLFSSIFTVDRSLVYAMALPNGKYLIKPRYPVVQLQRHHFIVSNGFHSGVMGAESITWGIQFSYPQLYLNPHTQEISKVDKSPQFPNSELFQRLAVWVRHHTVPTPFIYEEKQVNSPMRLGKNCFSWINNHPSLKVKKLQVKL